MSNQPKRFSDIKEELIVLLKDTSRNLGINEEVTIFEGILYQPFCTGLSISTLDDEHSVPMIMLIGKSGRLYFVSLLILMPHLTFKS